VRRPRRRLLGWVREWGGAGAKLFFCGCNEFFGVRDTQSGVLLGKFAAGFLMSGHIYQKRGDSRNADVPSALKLGLAGTRTFRPR